MIQLIPELQAVFRSLPHVNTPYGQWSAQGWAEISRRVNTFLGISLLLLLRSEFPFGPACIRTIPVLLFAMHVLVICVRKMAFTTFL